MLIFGHTGITLGAAVLLNRSVTKSHYLRTRQHRVAERLEPSSQVFSDQSHDSSGIASWFISLGNRIDIRLLLVGSLLPDIIDEPVAVSLLRASSSSGRTFFHTLIFLLLITLTGLYLYRIHRKT